MLLQELNAHITYKLIEQIAVLLIMLVLCSLRDCVDVFVYRGTIEDKPMTIYVTVDPERTHPFLASCKSSEKKHNNIKSHVNIQTSLSLPRKHDIDLHVIKETSLYPLTCMSEESMILKNEK